MVMMVVTMGCRFHAADFVMAVFAFCFGFYGYMGYAVVAQFLTDDGFYFMGICIGDDVQGGAGVLSIHAPEVDVVNILHTVNLLQPGFDLRHRNPVGYFL